MILIGYSGSSKADWILCANNKKNIFYTSGLDPFFLSEKEMIKNLQQCTEIQETRKDVMEVHFFGAGCLNPDYRERVSNTLSAIFRQAFINVEQDIQGAIYATCGNSRGISCILGTGSSSTYSDGSNIHLSKLGLGYILGDEGSGAYFGKRLIRDFLYGIMPVRLHKAFFSKYQVNKEEVVKRIYQKKLPNIYLASFTPFMSEHLNSTYIKRLIYSGFDQFIQLNVKSFTNYDQYPCHFIGSVAYHFRELLRVACEANNIQVGKILHRPIEELSKFILP